MRDTPAEGDTTVVDTGAGHVRGSFTRGAWRFRGIPFAEPPVGERRFRPPVPLHSWDGEIDGTRRPPIAPQPQAGMAALVGGADGARQSEEECLTLHVWTPAVDDGQRPVMVWIHGGAFVTGAGSIPWYDGASLCTRDVVVVSVNYRLGALGFLHLGALDDDFEGAANAGLLDQALALRWVHEHIAAFGGDPEQVTIFGESAGGMSVGCHLALPGSSGLFRRAIPQSGAASHVHGAEAGAVIAERIVDRLGLSGAPLGQLAGVPTDRILAAQTAVEGEQGAVGVLPFQPTVDGTTLPEHPLAAVAGGSAAGIDVLTGTTTEEMRLFILLAGGSGPADDDHVIKRVARHHEDAAELVAAYREARPDDSAADLEVAVLTDAVFRIPCIRLLDAAHGHNDRQYAYQFAFRSSAMGGRLGAAHAMEIPFVFDNLAAPGASYFVGEPDEEMLVLARAMGDAWTAFARTGEPKADGLPEWPRHDPERRATMVLDRSPTVTEDPGRNERLAWT